MLRLVISREEREYVDTAYVHVWDDSTDVQ